MNINNCCLHSCFSQLIRNLRSLMSSHCVKNYSTAQEVYTYPKYSLLADY